MRKRVLAIALLLLILVSIVPVFACDYEVPWNWRSARRNIRAWIHFFWNRYSRPQPADPSAEEPGDTGKDPIADKTQK